MTHFGCPTSLKTNNSPCLHASWPNAVLMRAQMMRLYRPNHRPLSHLQHIALGTCSRTEGHRRRRHHDHDKFHGA